MSEARCGTACTLDVPHVALLMRATLARYRVTIADLDGHAWEIAFNPACSIDGEGHVPFGA